MTDLTPLQASKLLCAATDALDINDAPRRGHLLYDRAWMARLEAIVTLPFADFAEACSCVLDVVAANVPAWRTSVSAASVAWGVRSHIAEYAIRMTGAEHLPAHGVYQFRPGVEKVVDLFPRQKAA
ncbi:hypothetical protein [Solirhodobacter olei]|uniref:hypothetical protein n=1 Tax=Solirhodobacter olei TaxID=2493082 RepID=UPI000FD975B0|nr:hypothetical protein [Solirhodobacter olei]